jgi:hypothetical protein
MKINSFFASPCVCLRLWKRRGTWSALFDPLCSPGQGSRPLTCFRKKQDFCNDPWKKPALLLLRTTKAPLSSTTTLASARRRIRRPRRRRRRRRSLRTWKRKQNIFFGERLFSPLGSFRRIVGGTRKKEVLSYGQVRRRRRRRRPRGSRTSAPKSGKKSSKKLLV